MKKTSLILAACAVLFCMTGCAEETTSEPVATTTAPIYVQEDGLNYAENEVLGSTTAATDTEGNPIETDETPVTTPSNPNGGGYVSTTTHSGGGGGSNPKPTYPTDTDDETDSVYNTTVELNIDEKSNIRFGDVEVFVWDAVGDDGKSGVGENIILGVNPYGVNKDVIVLRGLAYVDTPLEIEIAPNERCEYEFMFSGAGHTVKGTNEEKATMYMELQNQDGEIIEIDDVPLISGIDSYSVDIKAVASVLDEDAVIGILDSGKLRLDTEVDVKYEIITPTYTATDPLKIFVGFPYSELVAAIGEGVEMQDDEHTYCVYKTADHTLVVEHKIIEFTSVQGEKESSDVLTTIILIKNEIVHDDETEETDETETEEAEKVVLVPNIENTHENIKLSEFRINGNILVINRMTIADFLNKTGFAQCSYGATSLSKDDYTFESGMFGIQSDATDITSFEGTLVSVEAVSTRGELVPQTELKDKYSSSFIKGIHVSEFFTKDDIEVTFYGGIKVGTTKADVEAILGAGVELGDEIAYRNSAVTLIFDYEYDMDSGEKVVDSITLLINAEKP